RDLGRRALRLRDCVEDPRSSVRGRDRQRRSTDCRSDRLFRTALALPPHDLAPSIFAANVAGSFLSDWGNRADSAADPFSSVDVETSTTTTVRRVVLGRYGCIRGLLREPAPCLARIG